MYTRYPSIAGLFQKVVLLRDTKCNKIIQRRMHSETIVKLSKIESKFKPMKRCFSGAPNNRNFMPKTRHIQGVGVIRKSLPREMLSTNKQMRPNVDNRGMSVNSQSMSGNTQKSGKITIVIDKNEIFNCSAPNEDLQIHVTTVPDNAPSKRIMNEVLEADITHCAPQLGEMKNSRFRNSLQTRPDPSTFHPLKNVMSSPNHFPRRPQNVYGLPVRSFSGVYAGRPSQMEMLRRSRSMSDVPVMRKMIDNSFVQTPPRIDQFSLKMHRPSGYDPRSQSRPISSVGYHNSQPPNLQPKQVPNAIPSINQQKESYRIVIPVQNQQIPSRPVDVLEKGRNEKRINEINSQLRKYSSFNRNVLPANDDPSNKSEAKQSNRPRGEREAGTSGPIIGNQQPQRKRITERVVVPATFSPVGQAIGNKSHNISTALNEIAASQRAKSATLLNRTSSGVGLLRGPLMRSPNFINVQEQVTKNRFPVGRTTVTGMLNFQSQNASNAAQRAYTDNLSKNFGLKNFGPMVNATTVNVSSTNSPQRPASFPLKERNTTSVSHGNVSVPPKMLNQKHFLVQRQQALRPPINPVLPTTNLPHQLASVQPKMANQKHFLIQRRPPLLYLKKSSTLRPSVKPNHPIKNYKPLPTQRRPTAMRVNRMTNLARTKQPPQFYLKRKNLVPAMKQYRRKQRQPSPSMLRRRSSFIPVRQTSSLPPKVTYKRNAPPKETPKVVRSLRKTRKPTQASMIPVRNIPVQRNVPTNNFQQQIPIVPFEWLANPQLNRNNLVDSTKQPISVNQSQGHQNLRKMNGNQLQTSLPSRPNKIEKYVEQPKSVQVAGRPFPNQANGNIVQPGRPNSSPMIPLRTQQMFQPLPQSQMPQPMNRQNTLPKERRQMPPPRQITTPMKGQKDSPRKGQLKPQLRQMTHSMDGQKSSQTEKLSPPQLAVVAPKADDSNSNQNNQAVLFQAPGELRLVSVPVPRLADENGVIVKMLYVHLTDEDAKMLSAVKGGPYQLTQPTIAGKSGSGVVVDAGKQVDNVKVGDKVSVKGISCGKCTACENDNEIICERVPISEKLGILKQFHAVPAKFVTKLPDPVHLIDGAMIDELSSSVRACKRATVTAGDNVLVLGGKSLGLWTALAAKAMGATSVCLADARPLVLEQAKRLGIERVFLINPDSPVSSTSKSIAEYMEGDNPRIVFDCNGSPLTNDIAIKTSLIGGKVVLMKNSISNKPILLADAVGREIDILSTQHGNSDSERAALQLLSSGKVKLNGIESSFFDMSNVNTAFGLLNSGTISNIFIQPSRSDEGNGKKQTKNS